MGKIINTLKNINWKYYLNYIVVFAVGLVFTLLTTFGDLKIATLFLLEKILISIILAVSLSLVVGFLGELSLGHAGFMCVGAYFGGIVSMLFDLNGTGIIKGDGVLSFIISLVVGAAAAGICGFIIGLPALRLKGDYLAIVTLAFCEIIKTLFENFTFKMGDQTVGGPIGIKTPRFDKEYLFIIGFILVLITLAVLQNLIRSKHGRAITAIRDNEIAAHATGINVTKYKLVGFVISAVFAGAAGVFYSFANATVSASVFDYNYSIEILVMVVLGGMGNITGTMISATLITFLNIQLQSVLTGDFAVLKDIIYALILIIVIIYNNTPMLKGFREKYNFKKLYKKILSIFNKNKNHYADDEGEWARVPTKIDMNELLSTDFIVNESTKDADKGGKE